MLRKWDGDRSQIFSDLQKWLDEELEIIRARLTSEQAVLYGEYDRMISEAEFRVAIVVPLSSLK